MDDVMFRSRGTGFVADPFSYPRYTIKRPFFSFFERTFRVFAPDGRMIMFVRHPLLKLREEFNVWADDGQTLPLLSLKARQMVAINFAYDVFDARTNAWVGTLVKQGLRSLVRDTFDILDQGPARPHLPGLASSALAGPAQFCHRGARKTPKVAKSK